ncbi:hypothetical protein GCM10009801_26250 [Streptomyces albiaxialis]|uniref:DUF6542 domain-containing protein n=1 Tax=Streptomyces albiaxialis TaxID=329523 RepID=A0ABP5HDN6_9ACTN
MEQRSARTTQHDPRERRPAAAPGEGPEEGRAPRRPYRKPRLPRPTDSERVPGAAEAAAGPPPARSGRPPAPGNARNAHAGRPAGEAVSVHRARGASAGPAASPLAAKAAAVLAKLPAPRLTGLGTGVFAGLLMALWGWLDSLLFDASPDVYGVFFVLVCVAAALWVRPAELYAAPVAAPLAFTLGLFCVGGPGDGIAGQLQNVFTNLALHAGWLYGGTIVAAVLMVVRRVVLLNTTRRNRAARRRGQGA